MFCRNCGKQLEAGWSVCPDCGAEVKSEAQTNYSYQADQTYQTASSYQVNQSEDTYQANQTYQMYQPIQGRPPKQQETVCQGISIASMVLGIVGLLLSCIIIGAVPCIIGIILSLVALVKQDRKSGIAIAGFITSVVGILIAVVVFLALIFNDSGSLGSKGNRWSPSIDIGEEDGIVLELTVVNRTGVDIWYLFASETSSDSWEEDMLGDSVLLDGESVNITFHLSEDSLLWDFAMADSSENMVEFYSLDFSTCSPDGATLILEYDGTNGHARLY